MAEDYVGAIRESRITYGVPRIPLRMRRPDRGTVVHSDQGSQYASFDYQRLLTAHGLVCSMSRKGHCSDNAVVESFFHTIKTEPVGFEDYHTWDQARTSLFEYIEVFYNRLRRHSTPNYRSPVQFETVNMSPYPVSEISGRRIRRGMLGTPLGHEPDVLLIVFLLEKGRLPATSPLGDMMG